MLSAEEEKSKAENMAWRINGAAWRICEKARREIVNKHICRYLDKQGIAASSVAQAYGGSAHEQCVSTSALTYGSRVAGGARARIKPGNAISLHSISLSIQRLLFKTSAAYNGVIVAWFWRDDGDVIIAGGDLAMVITCNLHA